MTGEIPEVVVVDDDIIAARSFRDLVAATTGLRVMATADPEELLAAVAGGTVAVVVLDQRMPKHLGTDLYQVLIDRGARVRAIMLTGEADPDEVGSALELGFRGYLHKSQIRELPAKVLQEFVAHRAESISAASSQPVVLDRRIGLWRRTQLTFRMAGLTIVESSTAIPDSWRDIAVVQAGATEKRTIENEATASIVIEHSSQAVLSTKLGLSTKALAQLSTELSSQISSTIRVQRTETLKTRVQVERTFSLPNEPQDPDVVHVRMRKIQVGDAATMVRADLLGTCSCCSLRDILSIDIYVTTGGLILRHVDRLNTGEQRVYELGPIDSL